MQIMGQLQRIDTKETSFGTMYNIQVDGKWYGHGKAKPKASEGDTVSFEAEQKGQYLNVSRAGLEVLAAGQAAQQQPSAPPRVDTRQHHIEFQSSRAVAAQLVDIAVRAGAEKAGKEGFNLEAIRAMHKQLTWELMDEMKDLDEEMAMRYVDNEEG